MANTWRTCKFGMGEVPGRGFFMDQDILFGGGRLWDLWASHLSTLRETSLVDDLSTLNLNILQNFLPVRSLNLLCSHNGQS